MSRAWQTPRGARPNRRGELARLDECFRESEKTPFTVAQTAGKDEPSGRLLDPGREAGARGMIVTEHCCKVVHRTESGLGSSPANYPIYQYVRNRDPQRGVHECEEHSSVSCCKRFNINSGLRRTRELIETQFASIGSAS